MCGSSLTPSAICALARPHYNAMRVLNHFLSADLNEAAGAAAARALRTVEDRVVTGDSRDNTHRADARRARTPQLRYHHDPFVLESRRTLRRPHWCAH